MPGLCWSCTAALTVGGSAREVSFASGFAGAVAAVLLAMLVVVAAAVEGEEAGCFSRLISALIISISASSWATRLLSSSSELLGDTGRPDVVGGAAIVDADDALDAVGAVTGVGAAMGTADDAPGVAEP